MSVVISDTPPLRALVHLGHVEWLQVLFRRVLLPPAVAFELRRPPPVYHPIEVSTWAFLEVLAPTNAARVAELRSSLDVGEAEAIALAEEHKADIVRIDATAGRETAPKEMVQEVDRVRNVEDASVSPAGSSAGPDARAARRGGRT